ncbi:hypothetical protein DMTZ50_0038 [Dehalococcoides mccartyi]|nr:hypothetical protein [Dehalococcoides mccartyi]
MLIQQQLGQRFQIHICMHIFIRIRPLSLNSGRTALKLYL